MSLNKFMQPRKPLHKEPPDYARLAEKYPEFAKHCTRGPNGSVKVDYSDAAALKGLYCVLMEHFFNLDVDMPLNHLIPRVPQRTNYILWLEDLLDRPSEATGIDIG